MRKTSQALVPRGFSRRRVTSGHQVCLAPANRGAPKAFRQSTELSIRTRVARRKLVEPNPLQARQAFTQHFVRQLCGPTGLMPLEILHVAFVLFRRRAGLEGAEI